MKQDLIIYHGSQQIVEAPKFGIGKKYNDYGQVFLRGSSGEVKNVPTYGNWKTHRSAPVLCVATMFLL